MALQSDPHQSGNLLFTYHPNIPSGKYGRDMCMSTATVNRESKFSFLKCLPSKIYFMLPVNFQSYTINYYYIKKVKMMQTSTDDMHVQAAKAIKPNKTQLTKSPQENSHI